MITFLQALSVICIFLPFVIWTIFNFAPDKFKNFAKWKTIGITMLICFAIAAISIWAIFAFFI